MFKCFKRAISQCRCFVIKVYILIVFVFLIEWVLSSKPVEAKYECYIDSGDFGFEDLDRFESWEPFASERFRIRVVREAFAVVFVHWGVLNWRWGQRVENSCRVAWYWWCGRTWRFWSTILILILLFSWDIFKGKFLSHRS